MYSSKNLSVHSAFRNIVLGLTVSLCIQSAASAGFIRDAEIEQLLQDYSDPLFMAAGLKPDNIGIGIIADNRINAFVTNGQNIFFHTGLITEADTPNMVIGVIAHEIGHITGGHLARSRNAMNKTKTPFLVATILGLGSLMAGSPDLGMALMMGGQQVARQSYLTHSRSQEASADQAALQLLERSKQSPKGIIKLMNELASQEILSEASQDPYVRSHPMSRDRVNAYMSAAETSPYFSETDSADLQFRHELAKAKLFGFIDHPTTTRRRFKETDVSATARYARAIAYHKEAQTDKSVALIETLISEFPDNPWFREFKGQALFEGGRAKGAIQPYRDSLALQPDEPLLMIGLAACLVAEDQNNLQQKLTPEAIRLLRQALRNDKENLTAYMQLSRAYGQMEKIGLAEWALAEYYALSENPQAQTHAKRAIKILPVGSPELMRSQDISAQVFEPINPKRR